MLSKEWEQEFTWLEYDANCDGSFCRLCKMSKRSPGKTSGIWTTKPFSNWKKAIENLRAHAKSNAHILATQEAGIRLVNMWDQLFNSFKQYQKERKANRRAVTACAHFLAKINSKFLIQPTLRN